MIVECLRFEGTSATVVENCFEKSHFHSFFNVLELSQSTTVFIIQINTVTDNTPPIGQKRN